MRRLRLRRKVKCLSTKIKKAHSALSRTVETLDGNRIGSELASLPMFRRNFLQVGGDDLPRNLKEYERAANELVDVEARFEKDLKRILDTDELRPYCS